jgi:small subunit ribosomal protein S17
MVEAQNTGQDTAKKTRRKTVEGVVVSDKMQKGITVAIRRLELHRRYKKYIRRDTKFHAHDEKNDAKTGDTVRIMETRPLSKLKRWRLVEILKRGE